MEAPKKLKGKEFETEIIDAANRHRGLLKLGRYGTSARYDADGNMKAMKSNPDLEGTLAGAGRHIITECKVTSAKSLYLASRIKDDKADKQLKFMLAHAELGAICFYSIHFNARELKKGEVPAESWLMPVHQLMPYWRKFKAGEETLLNPENLPKHGGIKMEWTIPPRCRKHKPSILEGIYKVDEFLRPLNLEMQEKPF